MAADPAQVLAAAATELAASATAFAEAPNNANLRARLLAASKAVEDAKVAFKAQQAAQASAVEDAAPGAAAKKPAAAVKQPRPERPRIAAPAQLEPVAGRRGVHISTVARTPTRPHRNTPEGQLKTSSKPSKMFPGRSESIVVRVQLSSTEKFITSCRKAETAFALLNSMTSKIVNNGQQVANCVLADGDNNDIDPNQIVADQAYVTKMIASKEVPTLFVRQKDTPLPPKKAAALSPVEEAAQHIASLPSRNTNARATMIAVDTSDNLSIEMLFPGQDGFQGERVVVKVPRNHTVSQLKAAAFDAARSTPASVTSAREQYRLEGDWAAGSIPDEAMVLASLPYIQLCLRQDAPIRYHILQKDDVKKQKLQSMKIGNLIGKPIRASENARDEVSDFRNNIKRVRQEMINDGVVKVASLVPSIISVDEQVSMPVNFPQEMTCKFHLSNNSIVKMSKFDLKANPRSVLAGVCAKFASALTESPDPSRYLLKVLGQLDYLIDDDDKECEMWRYDYIRKCLGERNVPELAVVLKDSVKELHEADEEQLMFGCFDDPADADLDHELLTTKNHNPTVPMYTSLWDVIRPFRINIQGIDNVDFSLPPEEDSHGKKKEAKEGKVESCYVECAIFHGQEQLGNSLFSSVRNSSLGAHVRFNEFLTSSIRMCDLPKATRLCLTLWGQKSASKLTFDPEDDNNMPLAWVNIQLVNYRDHFLTGFHMVRMWLHDSANPLRTCVSNPSQVAPVLAVRFDEFNKPLVFPRYVDHERLNPEMELPPPTTEAFAQVEQIISMDPLYTQTAAEKQVLWEHRFHLIKRPEALPKLLMATNWRNREHVQEVHRLLAVWAPLEPVDSMELLDANFMDAKVRRFGVKCLNAISDEKLGDFLLQLVQALKYEPYHDSPLARFLLARALKNRKIGHTFFWCLKAELEVPEISERYSLLVEAYLRGCGAHAKQLTVQNDVLEKFTNVANAIKLTKDPEARKDQLQRMLTDLKSQLPSTFQILLNPKLEAATLLVEKCKYMDSKKLPLWLVMQNSDSLGRNIYIIFKSGDDLRQDMLTLQMFSIMDKLWEIAGLELRLYPYGCVATGPEVGMIEVVMNAETVANIQMQYGGTTAAFKEEPLAEWIRSHHPDAEAYEKAVRTFTLSSAAYCVATYVLGIGDRHNDNIMMQKSGRLFHIDFGHFLGNIKRKFGVRRERTPFVLTPDMVYVMGGRNSPGFQKFVDLCVEAHAVLRSKTNLFINLFGMMVSTGIPELRSTRDLKYLQEALCVNMPEEAAAAEFRSRIYESIDKGWSTQLNWWIHNVAHKR